jgi:hypothetical protein
VSDLEHRIRHTLEPELERADPRERISAYHDMPYAIFRYDPEEEFELRRQVSLLETRLSQKGKRVTRISLAECLDAAMQSQRPLGEWFQVEREIGTRPRLKPFIRFWPSSHHSSISWPLVDKI